MTTPIPLFFLGNLADTQSAGCNTQPRPACQAGSARQNVLAVLQTPVTLAKPIFAPLIQQAKLALFGKI
jgi:hypothetical protein